MIFEAFAMEREGVYGETQESYLTVKSILKMEKGENA